MASAEGSVMTSSDGSDVVVLNASGMPRPEKAATNGSKPTHRSQKRPEQSKNKQLQRELGDQARVMLSQSPARGGQAAAGLSRPAADRFPVGAGDTPAAGGSSGGPQPRLAHTPVYDSLSVLCQNQAKEICRINKQLRQQELENEYFRAELLELRRSLQEVRQQQQKSAPEPPDQNSQPSSAGENPARHGSALLGWRVCNHHGPATPDERIADLEREVMRWTQKENVWKQTHDLLMRRVHSLERRCSAPERSAATAPPPVVPPPPMAASPPRVSPPPTAASSQPLNVVEFHFPSEFERQPGDPVRVHPPGSDPLGNLDLDDLALSDRSSDDH